MNDILKDIIDRREDSTAMAVWLILHSDDVRMMELAEQHLHDMGEHDLLMQVWSWLADPGEAA